MKLLVSPNVKAPTRGTEESAGLDFYVPNDFNDERSLALDPGERIKIPSGVKMVLPKGKAGIFMNKSGIGAKGIFVGACVVDSDYRGEVHIDIHNVGNSRFYIEPGMKIVQMLIQKVEIEPFVTITDEEFNKLANTERGTGGFGSTGDK